MPRKPKRSRGKAATLAGIKRQLREGECATVKLSDAKTASVCKLGGKVRVRPGAS